MLPKPALLLQSPVPSSSSSSSSKNVNSAMSNQQMRCTIIPAHPATSSHMQLTRPPQAATVAHTTATSSHSPHTTRARGARGPTALPAGRRAVLPARLPYSPFHTAPVLEWDAAASRALGKASCVRRPTRGWQAVRCRGWQGQGQGPQQPLPKYCPCLADARRSLTTAQTGLHFNPRLPGTRRCISRRCAAPAALTRLPQPTLYPAQSSPGQRRPGRSGWRLYSAWAASRWNMDLPTPGGPCRLSTSGRAGSGWARWSQIASEI